MSRLLCLDGAEPIYAQRKNPARYPSLRAFLFYLQPYLFTLHICSIASIKA